VNVLRGLSSPVPYLSFEVNLPEFQSEGAECIRLLGELSQEGTFNYAVDCERGLGLKDWLRTDSFLKAFERCSEESVEVFWSNPRLNP